MKHLMRFGDLLDLEWFLEEDRRSDPTETLRRDRALGLEAQRAGIPEEQWGALWLSRRRAAVDGAMPSLVWKSAVATLRLFAVTFGLIAGALMTRGLLVYSGVEPVNVSLFWGVVVLPQALLCLVAAGLLALRVLGVVRLRVPLRPLFSWLMRRPGRLSSQMGFVRSVLGGSGWATRMAAWEGLSVLHLAGACVAVGSLAALLFSVAVTDLAFGWQSTLQVGAQGMHALVSVLALPWSWLPQEWGLCPSLAHIEGSRMVLKEGIARLENASLVAWWPFLAMSLGTYGMMPRLALFALCRMRLRHLERTLVHPDIGRIIDRMHAPSVETPSWGEPPSEPLPLGDQHPVFSEAFLHGAGDAAVGTVLVVPPELSGRIPEARLCEVALGVGAQGPMCVWYAPLEKESMIEVGTRLQALVWVRDRRRCVVVVEAWQPPIRESLEAIRILAAHVSSVALLLCGRPTPDNWFTPPASVEEETWAAAAERIGPDRIEIFGVPK
ncbi:MAG: DUF2868 domain-containing protein [Desulfomicrobiaceae bacterium]|nr:DUF2868 domain-containing protein [Desulfomicrobiaceae bacterium]